MARSKTRSAVREQNPNVSKPNNDQHIQSVQDAINGHWKSFPRQAKSFILDTLSEKNVYSLLTFWSSPQHIEFASGNVAGSMCGASWYLALLYLKLGKYKEAKALTINGSFLHQCYNTSIEYIAPFFENDENHIDRLTYLCGGLYASTNIDSMERYLNRLLPAEYQCMMSTIMTVPSQRAARQFVDQISEDWNNSSSSNNRKRSTGNNDEKSQINLIIANEYTSNDRFYFSIGTDTTLKTLFNEYADKKDISLRSLRFSYNGKTIFLSSVGHKTPKELGMHDQDVIMSSSSQPTTIEEKEEVESSTKKSPTKARSTPTKKAKGTRKKKGNNRLKVDKTVVDYKVEHSKYLTLLFEEAAPTFKQIRQDLNVIALECQKPKKKTTVPKQKDSKNTYVLNPSMDGLGSKAGKSRFVVLVGEVENLYKTTKPSASSHRLGSNTTCGTTSLDLHGCTREEALEKLDVCLVNWNEAAMHGSYPWVIPVNIICGCGNQILSETVEQWIKQTSKVANAPKSLLPSRNEFTPRVA